MAPKIVPCGHCGASIAAAAKACPQCGGPAPKKTSKFTWFVFVVLALPCLAGVVISASGGQSKADAAREKEHAALVAEPAAKEKERNATIQRLLNEGVLHSVTYMSETHQIGGTDVEVGSGFYALPFDQKQAVAANLWLAGWKKNKRALVVTLRDHRTNKEVGTFDSARGLRLD